MLQNTINILKKQLESVPLAPILVVGDLMLDEYHWCDVSRISPEAPVPVCKVNETSLMPGGAGNVAHNITAMGHKAHIMGFIGKDSS